MFKYLLFVLVATADVSPDDKKYYNILSIDGGGIKGVITVTCIA